MPFTPGTSHIKDFISRGMAEGPRPLSFIARKVARQPGAVVSIASFDASTATGDGNVFAFRKLSLSDDTDTPKRIVIETSPAGSCTWRFIPPALREEGVVDEGSWPREVSFCGKPMKITHDEWDMLKLDSSFDCIVKKAPELTTIYLKEGVKPTQTPRPKATVAESLSDEDGNETDKTIKSKPQFTFNTYRRKKFHGLRRKSRPIDEAFTSTDDEDEVSDMVDDSPLGQHFRSVTSKKVKENKEKARYLRRQWYQKRKEKTKGKEKMDNTHVPTFVDEDVSMMSASDLPGPSDIRQRTQVQFQKDASMMSVVDEPQPPPSPPPPSPGRQRAKTMHVSLKHTLSTSDDDSSDAERHRPKARCRTEGPKRPSDHALSVLDTPFSVIRARRHRHIEKRRNKLYQTKKEAKDEAFLQSLFTEVNSTDYLDPDEYPGSPMSEDIDLPESSSPPLSSPPLYSPPPFEFTYNADPFLDEDAIHRAELEESIRKMAELERDKPLWEQAARERIQREEERRRQEEATRSARQHRAPSAEEKQKQHEKKQAEDKVRRECEEAIKDRQARRQQLKQEADKDILFWAKSCWTNAAALQRYSMLTTQFDDIVIKVPPVRDPLVVFETIPWPVLWKPGEFTVADITWEAVEKFFGTMRLEQSKAYFHWMVARTNLRFHPDRWRSRNILRCIEDQEERECITNAGVIVSQVLTALWMEVRNDKDA